MIRLITGQPGHRKTVYALSEAMKLKKEGREVYAHGIKDLDYERAGFKPLIDPMKWEELPDGSVVIIDECYTTFPNRNPGAKVPEHVEAMARHRHRGFDFILIAQQGIQLDPFLRGLYDTHTHCKKKWGNGPTRLKQWSAYQSNVNGVSADVDTFSPSKELFTYYTSTVINTSKWNVPNWAKYTAAGLFLLVGVTWFVKYKFESKATGTEQSAARPQSVAAAGGPREGEPIERYATLGDYAKAHLPRFPTLPWSAPIYDSRAVVSEPELICASSSAGHDANGEWKEASCTCLTEQATRYDMSDGECRRMAKQGPVYNPYKHPRQEVPAAAQPVVTAAIAAPAGAVPATGTKQPYGAFPQPSGTFSLDPQSPGGAL